MAGQGPPGSDGQGPRLTPHSSRLTPHSSRLTPHSSRLTPHSSRLTPQSSPYPAPAILPERPHPVCVSENVRPSHLSSRKWLRVPGVARRHQFAHRRLGPALARRRRPISSPPARTVNGPLGMVPLRGGTRSLPQATIGGIIRLSSLVRPDCPSLPAPGLRSRGQTADGRRPSRCGSAGDLLGWESWNRAGLSSVRPGYRPQPKS